MHWWSKEELEFLSEQYQSYTIREMLPMFNERFNVDVSFNQLKGAIARNKILSGRDGCFSKGHEPFNKGKKGLNFGGKETQFKKGNKPPNFKSVGSERITKDGYIEIKIADPNKWRLKHLVVWEEVNGPLPKGHCLIFLDSNRLNITLENLQLITRNQLARLNQNNLISDNPDITKTGIVIADIYCKIGERKKTK